METQSRQSSLYDEYHRFTTEAANGQNIQQPKLQTKKSFLDIFKSNKGSENGTTLPSNSQSGKTPQKAKNIGFFKRMFSSTRKKKL